MDKMKMETPNQTAGNIEKIKTLFPSCITESKDANGQLRKGVNFELLRQLLSEDVVEGNEAYEFTWVGKKAAIVEANRPIRKTLRPCPEESVDWDTTENLYIEGDNLEVLKLLQESYLGKVKMIYIDPPYNTGNDFIYRDKFAVSSEEYDTDSGAIEVDTGNRLFKNTDTNGRFHSDWCSMIYSRIILASNLLSKNGVMAISIGYDELHNLMKICQELFSDKQVFAVTIQTSGGKPNGAFSISCEYIIFIVPEDFIPFPTREDMKEYTSAYHGMNLATFNQVQRPNQTYPIYVDDNGIIVGCGKSLQERISKGLYTGDPSDFKFDYEEAPNGTVAIWPVTAKGDQCVWRLIPERLLDDWNKGYIKVVALNNESYGNKYTIQYLSGGIIDKIQSGELETYRISDNPKIPTLEIRNYKTAGSGISSIWIDNNYYTTRGSNEIRTLFPEKLFSYPKPLALILYLLKRTVSTNDIVLDFFSGSATTAHAVMQLNAERMINGTSEDVNLENGGGGRQNKGSGIKYIMVQLPEPCDEKSEAYKAGYKNICEIGKERIRRAGRKIRDENPLLTDDLDIGFRVLKLDDTNMNDVYYAPSDYTRELLEQSEDNIKDDRTDLDLLFGCLLDWGVTLSDPYESIQIEGCTVHNYNNGDLVACFDKDVPESVIKEIAKMKPERAVFRESCFKDSAAKINVEQIFKMLAPDMDVDKDLKII